MIIRKTRHCSGARAFTYTFIITLLMAGMLAGLSVAYVNSANAMRPPSEQIAIFDMQIKAQSAEVTVFGIKKTLPLPPIAITPTSTKSPWQSVLEGGLAVLLPAEVRLLIQGLVACQSSPFWEEITELS